MNVEPCAVMLENVTLGIGEKTLLSDVTVALGGARPDAIIGRSGAGKSVLLRAIFGAMPLTAGRIDVRRPPLVLVAQEPALLDDLDVWENVHFAASRIEGARGDAHARTEAAVAALGLAPLARLRAGRIPLGAQRRVALARALALEPGTLMADEPTSGLDPEAAREVDEALVQVARRGTALIVVTHHPRTLAALGARAFRLVDGTLQLVAP